MQVHLGISLLSMLQWKQSYSDVCVMHWGKRKLADHLQQRESPNALCGNQHTMIEFAVTPDRLVCVFFSYWASLVQG